MSPQQNTSQQGLDFSVCEQEVLAHTGLIQPQGAVLLVSTHDGRPLACSENWLKLTGCPVPDWNQVFDWAAWVQEAPPSWGEPAQLLTPIKTLPADVQLLGCRQGDLYLLEWIVTTPASRPTEWPLPEFSAQLNPYALSQAVATQLRQVLQLDRVMVYKFDHHQAGDVIAEARRTDWEPFLGLHYPATDIPQVARKLYLRAPLRQIHDVESQPVALLSAAEFQVSTLDLSACSLRSVSPYHLAYLKNMGVRASLSVAIIVEQQLWGLISCHHGESLVMGWQGRDYLLAVAAALSTAIVAFQVQRRQYQQAALQHNSAQLRVLLTDAATRPQVPEHLLLGPYGLLAMLRTQSAMIYTETQVLATGQTPPYAWVKRLADYLLQQPDGSFCTEHLLADSPLPLPVETPWSGLLARIVFRAPLVVLLVWRESERKEVHWGGDPAQAAELDAAGQLTPRHSFALWKEFVKDRSRPWQDSDLATMEMLIQTLQAVFKAQDLCELLPASSADLFKQMQAHHYIARTLSHGAKHGLVMTLLESAQEPPRILQLNQDLQDFFELTPDQWTAGEPVRPFLARLGLIQNSFSELSLDLSTVFDVWSPVLGHRVLMLNRQVLLNLETDSDYQRLVNLQFVDITGSERVEGALRAALAQGITARLARTRLIANLSHEIRAPLQAVVGYTRLIQRELANPSAQPKPLTHYLEQIQQASQHMLMLAEQQLAGIRSAQQASFLPVEAVDLGQVISQALDWYQSRAEAQQVSLKIELDETLPLLEANRQSLRQVLINLIANAIKFSKPGGTVTCALMPDAQPGYVRLEIRDTGLGMSETDRLHAFEVFYQGQQGASENGGAGIGLHLVQAIVQAHHGEIDVESILHQGTTVRIRLPLKQKQARLELRTQI